MAKAGPKRTREQRQRDMVTLAEMYLAGKSQSSIALALNVTRQQVMFDLEKLRQEWRMSAIRDFDTARAIELAKLDKVERTLWEAWERSLQPVTHKAVHETEALQPEVAQRGPMRVVGEPKLKVTARKKNVKEVTGTGNVAFLNSVVTVIQTRIQLLGLNAPQRIDITEEIRVLAKNAGLDDEEAISEAQRWMALNPGA